MHKEMSSNSQTPNNKTSHQQIKESKKRPMSDSPKKTTT